MFNSLLFFGNSALTDVSVHSELDFQIRFSFAYKHAERLSGQMLSVCQQKIPDGITTGKFFIDGTTTKYVCHFYKLGKYVQRVLFAEKYPRLYYWFGWLLPKAECARATLTWPSNDLSGTPTLTFSSPLFNQYEERDIEAILAPLLSNDSRYLDELIFG